MGLSNIRLANPGLKSWACARRRFVMNIPRDRYLSIPSVRRRLKEVTAMANGRFPKRNTSEELAKPAVWVASKNYPLRLSRDSALA